MPIPSRKPSPGRFNRGTEPTPMVNDFASEAQVTDTTQARRNVAAFNSGIISLTQPYNRASELRAGQAFPMQQQAMIAAEHFQHEGPYSRGMNSVELGTRRPLRDVGP